MRDYFVVEPFVVLLENFDCVEFVFEYVGFDETFEQSVVHLKRFHLLVCASEGRLQQGSFDSVEAAIHTLHVIGEALRILQIFMLL